jgi:hypothetical protein
LIIANKYDISRDTVPFSQNVFVFNKGDSVAVGQGVVVELEGGDVGEESHAARHSQHRPLPLLQNIPQQLLRRKVTKSSKI